MEILNCIHLILFFEFFYDALSEKIRFLNVEHPRVAYFNTKYLKYVNLTTKRYGRANPIYYVGLHFENVVPLDKHFQVDFYFLELLTNVYKPSFIEFHYNWCHLVENDMIFGSTMRQGKLLKPCPHPPGAYNLVNMTVNSAAIPPGFPFTKGRIQANVTIGKDRVADGWMDMTIVQIDKKKAKF